MQPYFLPYIGYFQLIAAVDLFIVYDNIKYTKKGWINRNRILQNDKDVIVSLSLRKDSDFLNVCQRELAADFDRTKMLNQIRGAYIKAPHFEQTFELVERIMEYGDNNLFRFLHHSISKMCEQLGVSTEIKTSSELSIDHQLKGQEKVLAMCEAVGAGTYVNAIGGLQLYSRDSFQERGINLRFLKSSSLEYPQFDAQFIPWLSIVDVMMFNPLDAIQQIIMKNYELI